MPGATYWPVSSLRSQPTSCWPLVCVSVPEIVPLFVTLAAPVVAEMATPPAPTALMVPELPVTVTSELSDLMAMPFG